MFDLDGVLVDSFQVMREAFAIAYRQVVGAGEPPVEAYLRHQGRYFRDIMRIMDLPVAMEQPFVEASHRLLDRTRVYTDVPGLLRALDDHGIGTAVATGKSAPRARAVLDFHGLLPLLDTVVGSDQVSRPKPMPDIVQEALQRLAAPPETALMVGDAVADLQSGHAAGVATAAALWGETTPERLRAEPADFFVERPRDLLDLVRGLGGTIPGPPQTTQPNAPTK